MRDVWKMMEILNKNCSKPFIKLAIGIYIVLMAVYFMIIQKVEAGMLVQSRIWLCMPYIAGACIVVLHLRRVRKLHHEGNMTRVMLLPVPRFVYPIAEMLFTLGTICLCLLAGYLAIFSVIWLYFQHVGWLRNGVVYMIANFTILRMFLPLSLAGLGMLLLSLVTFTLCINVCMMLYNRTHLFVLNFFFYFIATLILCIFAMPSQPEYAHRYFMIAIMLGMDLYAIYQIIRLFRYKKVGG